MATVKQLWDSSVRVSPARRVPPSSGSRRIVAVIPYPKFKSVLFQLEHFGVTVPAQHAVNIWFSDTEVFDTKQDLRTHLVVTYKGQQFWVRKPDYYVNQVRVRCSCPDFYFTFAYWDWEKKVIFGPKPRPYTRKSVNGKPRNPGKFPGFCKHVMNSLLLLQTNNWTGVTKFSG